MHTAREFISTFELTQATEEVRDLWQVRVGDHMSKSCGACKHFQKWRRDKFGGGLCELKDLRTKTDRGHDCKEFKRIKLHRSLLLP
jgi:cytochrome c2